MRKLPPLLPPSIPAHHHALSIGGETQAINTLLQSQSAAAPHPPLRHSFASEQSQFFNRSPLGADHARQGRANQTDPRWDGTRRSFSSVAGHASAVCERITPRRSSFSPPK